MFLMHVITAWVLWRIFYWKWPYAVALAVIAGVAHLTMESLTGSTLTAILVVVPALIVVAWSWNRESILRPTSSGGGAYSYRLDDEDAGRAADDDGSPGRSGER